MKKNNFLTVPPGTATPLNDSEDLSDIPSGSIPVVIHKDDDNSHPSLLYEYKLSTKVSPIAQNISIDSFPDIGPEDRRGYIEESKIPEAQSGCTLGKCLKYGEALFATLPEGITGAFFILRETQRLEALFLAVPLTVPMYILELNWMGPAIEHGAGPTLNPYITKRPNTLIKQISLTLGPLFYALAVIQAGLAVKMSPMGIFIAALSQYSLQLMKACFSYDEWAKANDVTQLEGAYFLVVPLRILHTFGILKLATHIWTAIEWYIHKKAISEFATILNKLLYFYPNQVKLQMTIQIWNQYIGSLIPSLYLGSCQTIFTQSFDVTNRFQPLLERLGKIMSKSTPRENWYYYPFQVINFIQDLSNTLVKNYLTQPILQNTINGTYLNKINTAIFGKTGALYLAIFLKTVIGMMMGTVGGKTAYEEIGNASTYIDSAKNFLTFIIFLGAAYGFVNFVQGYYAKFNDAKKSLSSYPNFLLSYVCCSVTAPKNTSANIDTDENNDDDNIENNWNSNQYLDYGSGRNFHLDPNQERIAARRAMIRSYCLLIREHLCSPKLLCSELIGIGLMLLIGYAFFQNVTKFAFVAGESCGLDPENKGIDQGLSLIGTSQFIAYSWYSLYYKTAKELTSRYCCPSGHQPSKNSLFISIPVEKETSRAKHRSFISTTFDNDFSTEADIFDDEQSMMSHDNDYDSTTLKVYIPQIRQSSY